MTALQRRLGRLETMTGIGVGSPMIFVSFGADDPMRRILSATTGGHEYHRAEDEADDAFCSRVIAEAEGRQLKTSSRVAFLRYEKT